jgi:hypothetical protein
MVMSEEGSGDKYGRGKSKRVSDSMSAGSSGRIVGSSSSSQSGGSAASPGENFFAAGDPRKNIDEYAQLAINGAAAKVEQLFNEKIVFLDQAERKVHKMLSDSTKLMSTINAGLETSRKLTESSLRTQEELQGEVQSIKGSAISALSVFVSFFAFITVAINVFAKAETVVSASVLVLIFWCLLIGFNILISIQFKTIRGGWLSICSLIFVILVSVLSILAMFYFSPELRGVQYVFKFSV